MCGRIDLHTPPAQLARIFNAQLGAETDPGRHWNVGPTSTILGLTLPAPAAESDEASRLVLRDYRWGLIPSSAKVRSGGGGLFNARAETVARAPSFRSAFEARRVAVIADGFFEWRKGPGKLRQPHYFTRRDGQPLTFAGLYEYWRAPALEESPEAWLRSCTIITTNAGEDMEGVHDRMPVVLSEEQRQIWLDRESFDQNELLSLLGPASAGTLMHHAVDQRVGNVRNDDPGLIAPSALANSR